MSRFSNWREDLNAVAMDEGRGLMVLEVMTDEKDQKKVKEKKVNNAKLIKINPNFKEAIEDLGGELIEMKEIDTDVEDKDKEDSSAKQLKNKEKRVSMMKRQILMRKMMAVKQGAGADIVASYEPNIQGAIEYFYEEGINEEGIDLLIEEIGLEEFVNFIDESVIDLNEERAARRANVKAKSYADVKADVDKKDAAKKKAKKGEYAPSYAKKETDVTVYDDKPAAKKKAPAKKAPAKKPVAKKVAPKPVAVKKPVTKKVVKAVAKVKKTQPVKKPSKQGLGDRISSAYKAGVKRHRKATQGARVFGKGVAAGAKKAVKFARDVKKVVSEEELDEACWKGYKAYGMKKKGNRMVPNCKPVGSVKKEEVKMTKKAYNKLHKDFKSDDPKNPRTTKYNPKTGGTESHPVKFVDEAKVDEKLPEYKRATARDKRYGNPHGSHALGGGIRKDRRADHEAKRGVKEHHQKDANGKVIEHEDTTPSSVEEAKVDKGRSDYGKASIRNYRSKGPGYGEPAMFDPENKRGKLIDKRRADHKARRGVKGAKVPAYKVEGYQRDPERLKKDKTRSKQPDPSKDGFTGIGNMSIADIKKMNDRMKKEEVVSEADKKGKGSGKKDACYHKVKASASVWPSAYASGRLVQCRKKGAANYGNSKKESYSWRDELDFVKEGAAWTKKSGKNPKGGLNEKGRKSYEAENPGSDLKAPSKKPGNKRRASFCARMKGMKKKLTSAKTARDPDSRINKSLRAWNCGYEPDGTPIMEKDAALDFVRNKYKGQIYDPKKVKKPSEADKAKAAAERKKRQDADNKAYASRAKKAGFKSTQDYTDVVARYGSEDNYRKGKGLGT